MYLCINVYMHSCMYVYRYIQYTVCIYLLVFMAIKCRGAKFRWFFGDVFFVASISIYGLGH